MDIIIEKPTLSENTVYDLIDKYKNVFLTQHLSMWAIEAIIRKCGYKPSETLEEIFWHSKTCDGWGEITDSLYNQKGLSEKDHHLAHLICTLYFDNKDNEEDFLTLISRETGRDVYGIIPNKTGRLLLIQGKTWGSI